MDQTPNLKMPYILPSQAQKHVTHNEALRLLDAVVHLSVKSRNRAEAHQLAQHSHQHHNCLTINAADWPLTVLPRTVYEP